MTRSRRRTRLPLLAALVLLIAAATPGLAYLKIGTDVNGRTTPLKWPDGPVRYFVTAMGVPGVSVADFQLAVSRAFQTWQDVPTASITYEFGGLTGALPGEDDLRSTLGFLSIPELDRVLASTSFLIDEETGQILESDIFFNSAFPWSIAPGGENNRFDLQSTALHEIGHFSGLGHSALGETELSANGRRVIAAESVMFPIAFPPGSVADRALRADDIAGISDVYPDNGFNSKTGSTSGRILLNGQGVFGAHIVALHLATGAIVGNFSLDRSGQFSIAGLAPGAHILRVEPLDDGDVESFFAPENDVEVDFRVTFPNRIVIVPAGGDSGPVNIEVNPK